jgi:hypothetical protein
VGGVSGPAKASLTPGPQTPEDRDRARMAVASAARDAVDAAVLLGALGLDRPDDIADHLNRRRRTT